MHAAHPSMWPGAIIGYRKSGTPIRLIAGGAPDDDGQGAGDGQGDGAGTGDNGQGGNNDGDTAGTGGQSDAGTGQQQGNAGAGASPSGEGNAMRAVREEAKAAKQAARELREQLAALQAENTRRDQETTERNKALAKALGLPGSEDPPDPAQLARELEAAKAQTTAEVERAQARERELTVELELLKQARRHGADPELLVDSRSFMQTLGKLDPTSDDFGDDLGEAIKTAVEKNPGFKLATTTPPATTTGDGSAGSGPSNASAGSSGGNDGGAGDGQTKPKGKQGTTAPPARSGTDTGHNGAPGGNRQWTDEDVNRASPSEVSQAMKDGLLVNLGVNPPKNRR